MCAFYFHRSRQSFFENHHGFFSGKDTPPNFHTLVETLASPRILSREIFLAPGKIGKPGRLAQHSARAGARKVYARDRRQEREWLRHYTSTLPRPALGVSCNLLPNEEETFFGVGILIMGMASRNVEEDVDGVNNRQSDKECPSKSRPRAL